MGGSNLLFWFVNYNCHVHMTEQITSTSRKLAQKYICAVKPKYALRLLTVAFVVIEKSTTQK